MRETLNKAMQHINFLAETQKIPLDQTSCRWQHEDMAANEVVELRKRLGLDQTQLSEAFGFYSHNTVSRWETGLRKPSESLRRIFRLLNDLPAKDAEEFVKKLGQYKTKKR